MINIFYKIRKVLKIIYFFYIIYEKIQGVDFTETVSIKKLGFTNDRSVHYEATNAWRLRRVLNSMSISNKDSIIDYGCGKGKAMYIMSKYPFKIVTGIELSKDLCDIAERNLKKKSVKNFNIINCDASDYEGNDDYNYFYFFNPFPSKIMRNVIDNIETSINKSNRNVTLVYLNPRCHNEVIKNNIFKLVDIRYKTYIYINEQKNC